MSVTVRFRPEAGAELLEAVEWYEGRGPGLGAEFLRSLDAAVALVQRNPLSYPLVFGNARRAVLRRFPYSLIYEPSGDDILVVACIHGRRDPKHWHKRTS
jgi:plasmid stabilization system protein ParE